MRSTVLDLQDFFPTPKRVLPVPSVSAPPCWRAVAGQIRAFWPEVGPMGMRFP
jgi:hypothetical protein